MTRFTAIALALLLVVPAKAADCPWIDAEGNCLSVQCNGERLLREAYKRGEITSVHLSRRSECISLYGPGPRAGEIVYVPCTWDYDDYFKP